ncbi:hypothetical protein SCYAM73S_05217 [Streptomyces cyaneofuscatus]
MFHTRLPAVVSPTNTGSGMRSTPAGTEIRLRKTGTMRPSRTALVPCRANHSSVRTRSEGLTSGSLAQRACIRSRPNTAPSPYSASAPTTEPSVVQNSAEARLSTPCDAANPVSGRMISLGSGGNRFSRAMARPAPGPPNVSTSPVASSAIPPFGSSRR